MFQFLLSRLKPFRQKLALVKFIKVSIPAR